MSGEEEAVAAIGARRILVVDDEAMVRGLAATVLRRQGYVVFTAENAEDALQVMAAECFDLMLTDLQMPGPSGLELVREAHDRFPQMAAMVMTAYGTIETAVQAMQYGALDFVCKPWTPQELSQKVVDCLARQDRRLASADRAMSLMVELLGVLSSQADLDETLLAIVDLLRRAFDAKGVQVRLFSKQEEEVAVVVATGVQIPSDTHSWLQKPQVQELARRDRPWGVYPASDGAQEGQAFQCVCVPLHEGPEVVGSLVAWRSPQASVLSLEQGRILQMFARQIGLALRHGRTRQSLQEAVDHLQKAMVATVRSLSEVLETFDSTTRAHSERVSRDACALGRKLGLGPQEMDALRLGGLLHDLGKLGIADGTLQKPAALSLDEYDRIKLHPVLGARILGGIEAFEHVVPIVRWHHEQWDGGGYPDGLSGDEIPRLARIVAVVDTYDALTNDRPYRDAAEQRVALSILKECSGSKLEPHLVNIWTSEVQARDGEYDA